MEGKEGLRKASRCCLHAAACSLPCLRPGHGEGSKMTATMAGSGSCCREAGGVDVVKEVVSVRLRCGPDDGCPYAITGVREQP
jgi:hypothetical protein